MKRGTTDLKDRNEEKWISGDKKLKYLTAIGERGLKLLVRCNGYKSAS